MVNVNDNKIQTEFNFAIAFLQRLDFWYSNADMSAYSLDAQSWFLSLINIFRELSTYMKDEDIDHFQKQIMLINEKISINQKIQERKNRKHIPNELYFLLHNFELKLRQITQKSGIQMKMKDDESMSLR